MKWIALAVLFLVLLVLWRQMFAGWRARLNRQADIAAPARLGAKEPGSAAVEGVYVSTVDADNALERIAVHGLGTRSAVHVEVGPQGVALFRAGARSFAIPRADLVGVGRGPGMVGKFVGRDGLVVLRWKLGDRVVDTGIRPRRAEEGNRLVQQVQQILAEGQQR
ncbi:hypothetical protein CLV92_105131 [Kineococcus xinjiangensis]|uniref:PH domain-containing protein n=1 Tax=Kineococcus xinjiangensis TaxID=512762 RepID=A0A2S6IPC4_9ACTN|nr:hypothetical protein [Kineococcus xinjiangensis]PPK96031.1 hypothetical protein CLV92_105131 [Kineococcus xinjiangensis]